MAAIKVYEYVTGLSIDCPLTDSEREAVPVSSILASKFYVMRPNATVAEEWETVLIEPNILRHVVPEDADLLPGKYKVQPYIETTDGYKGRCDTFELDRKSVV